MFGILRLLIEELKAEESQNTLNLRMVDCREFRKALLR